MSEFETLRPSDFFDATKISEINCDSAFHWQESLSFICHKFALHVKRESYMYSITILLHQNGGLFASSLSGSSGIKG